MSCIQLALRLSALHCHEYPSLHVPFQYGLIISSPTHWYQNYKFLSLEITHPSSLIFWWSSSIALSPCVSIRDRTWSNSKWRGSPCGSIRDRTWSNSKWRGSPCVSIRDRTWSNSKWQGEPQWKTNPRQSGRFGRMFPPILQVLLVFLKTQQTI